MNVYWLTGVFTRVDGSVGEDYELLPTVDVTTLPETVGDGGCKFEASTFIQR